MDLSTASRSLDPQLCQKLSQPLSHPPFPPPPLPQPPLCQPPLPQPPLPQQPLCQPKPPLPQPRRQRPQPPLPHQAGVALASPSGSKLAEPVMSETPARIVCKRAEMLCSGGVGVLICGFEFAAADASEAANAKRTDAPNAPAGSTTESFFKTRFQSAIHSP